VATCVTDRLLRLRFPVPGSDAPVTATYEMVFSPD